MQSHSAQPTTARANGAVSVAPSSADRPWRYLRQVHRAPLLEREQEYMLAKRWREHGDIEAANTLVTSHLRLVAKIAMGYRGYGLPVSELISEGNVGMMEAVKRFDPERGVRLSTYAMWWIRAAIQRYALRSHSVVKMGTTPVQKKLFLNLRKVKARIERAGEQGLSPDQLSHIATELNVSEADVEVMNGRMSGPDHSLNAPLHQDSEDEWQDRLVDDDMPTPETLVTDRQELEMRRGLLAEAMETLNERERHILTERRLRDEPLTLEELSQQYGISRERVRQIEVRAFEELRKAMIDASLNKSSQQERPLAIGSTTPAAAPTCLPRR